MSATLLSRSSCIAPTPVFQCIYGPRSGPAQITERSSKCVDELHKAFAKPRLTRDHETDTSKTGSIYALQNRILKTILFQLSLMFSVDHLRIRLSIMSCHSMYRPIRSSPAKLLVCPAPHLSTRLLLIVAKTLVPVQTCDAFHIFGVESGELCGLHS